MRHRKLIVGSVASEFGFVNSDFDSNMHRDLAHCRLGQQLMMTPT
ncbi:hypothetical protein SLEP1_g1560 [Rubroshorea leprosula]|uniref:Uncharacterized protein n=1 Tax=Rubroshorea leprosula TaxID=152421 RepID=A0AAV5HK33_9ROSI|nr:hypothetical protein SLEP1_g1560 [Rubroshorea leprosula]